MKRTVVLLAVCLCGATLTMAQQFKLTNKFISRTIRVDNGVVKTSELRNMQTKSIMKLVGGNEFSLRFSEGTDKPGTQFVLTAKDFDLLRKGTINPSKDVKGLRFLLKAKNKPVTVELKYLMGENDFFIRKYLTVLTTKSLVLEKVVVEDLQTTDKLSSYTHNEIYSNGVWKPNLGQPVYDLSAAMFLGVEFPASINTVNSNRIECAYLSGRALTPVKKYDSYKAVVGVADDAAYLDDAFFAYINTLRRQPSRLQIQYNTWFDYGGSVTKEKFATSVHTVYNELVTKRGCKPLNAYVIDDGWQNNAPKQDDPSVWMVNNKFDGDFRAQFDLMKSCQSKLGLWLSPGCCFGAQPMVTAFDKMGYEALMGKNLKTMSLSGPVYMQKLEDRVLDLTRQGVEYFKFDGLFGHLYIRNFELKGRGTAFMPQLVSDTMATDSRELNNAKYNELKDYYLTSGSERLIEMFKKMATVNPKVYIAITNGAYLSAWWLQYVDIVWLINASDGAAGDNRTAQLVYRDNIYHRIWKEENTKFPMNAIFNHEPKKTAGDKETPQQFRDYLFMNLSRGTNFIELYLKTTSLTAPDWDVLAEGLKWAQANHEAFENVRMLGGNPSKKEVYGYAGWNARKGYISLHNPSDKTQTFTLRADRHIGFSGMRSKATIQFRLNPADLAGIKTLQAGKSYSVTLKPAEIVMISYN